MQEKTTLNPSYTGPGIIEEYLRKIKSQSSFGRIISTYNKRYFILDMTRQVFYYLPEKDSHFSNSVSIPLDTITRMYVDSQLEMLDEGSLWKHGFVIVTRKRVFRLIAHTRGVMDKFLHGFAHIIDNETHKPIFDWSEYKQVPISSLPMSQISAPIMNDANMQEQSPLQKNPSPPQGDYRGERRNTEESPIEQRGENLRSSVQLPHRHLKASSNTNLREETPNNSQRPGKEQPVADFRSEDNPSMLNPKESTMFRGNTYGKTTTEIESEVHRFSNNRITSMDDPGVIDNHSNFHINRNEPRDDRRQRVEPVRAQVEAVNIEEIEIVPGRPKEQRRSSSVRRDSSVRRNSIGQAQKEQPSPSKPATQTKKNGSEPDFTGFHQVDVAYYQKKKASSNFWEDDQVEKVSSYPRVERERPRTIQERKLNIGNGIQVSFPKFDEVSEKQDLPVSYMNMMQEAKKFSPFMGMQYNEIDQAKSRNTVNEVKNSRNDDDDWDKEMFGDDDKEKTNKSIGKGINKDFSSNNLTGFQESRLSQVKKNQLCHKKSEILASREEAYNDWDDDL